MEKTTLPVLDLTGDKDLSEKQSFPSREFWSPTTVSLNQAGHVPRFNEVKYSYGEVKCRRHKHRLSEPIENLAKSDKLDKHDVKMAVKKSHDSNATAWRDNGSNPSAWRDNGSNTDSNSDFKTTVLKKRKSRRTFELAPTGETREIATLLVSNNHVQDTTTKKVHTAKDTDLGGVNHRDDGQDTTPFQTKTFMSSSMMKKISIPRRYHDSFGGPEYSMTAQRGVPLHTPRYLCDGPVYQESADQRDRLQTGYDYMERLKYFKLRREMWPHRANIDFMMAGKKVEFDERFDLNKELDRLKAMVLPQVARDLLHGKGVSLPPTHGSIKPRKLPNLTCDYDSSSAPASTAQKVAKAKTYSDEHSSSSAFGISITSLPAIDDHALDMKRGSRIANARHHTKSLRSLLSL